MAEKVTTVMTTRTERESREARMRNCGDWKVRRPSFLLLWLFREQSGLRIYVELRNYLRMEQSLEEEEEVEKGVHEIGARVL